MKARAWIPITSGAQVLAILAGAATNLLYARLLAPGEIGRVALVAAAAVALVLVADLGLQLLVTREVAVGTLTPERALGMLVVTVPPIVAVAWLVAAAAAAALHVDGPWSVRFEVLELAAAVAGFQISLTMSQAMRAYGRRAALVSGNALLTAGFTAAALGISAHAAAAIHATAAGYAAVAVVGLVSAARGGLDPPGLAELRRELRRARPLWANSAVTFVTSSADVLLAGALLPLAAVGYYQVFKKLALAVVAPLAALLPPVFAQLSALPAAGRIALWRRVQLGAVGVVAVGLVVAGPILRPLCAAVLGGAYGDRVWLFVALVALGALQFVHNLLGYVLTASGRFAAPLAINGAVAAVAVALAWPLATRWSVGGFVGTLAAANGVGIAVGGLLVARLATERVFRTVCASVMTVGAAVSAGALPLAGATTPFLAAAALAASTAAVVLSDPRRSVARLVARTR